MYVSDVMDRLCLYLPGNMQLHSTENNLLAKLKLFENINEITQSVLTGHTLRSKRPAFQTDSAVPPFCDMYLKKYNPD